jgi:hypothetical protein
MKFGNFEIYRERFIFVITDITKCFQFRLTLKNPVSANYETKKHQYLLSNYFIANRLSHCSSRCIYTG